MMPNQLNHTSQGKGYILMVIRRTRAGARASGRKGELVVHSLGPRKEAQKGRLEIVAEAPCGAECWALREPEGRGRA